MTDQNVKPPPYFRLLMALCRRVPPFRGRGRIFAVFHRYLSGKGWNEKILINGCYINLLLDDLISRTIYIEGNFDSSSTEAIYSLVRPDSVVFDVGANIGYYTLLFAKLVGNKGKVYAFEPIPTVVSRLNSNLKENTIQINRVTVFDIALSNKNSVVEMNISSNINTGASHVATSREANDQGRSNAGVIGLISVPSRTGDSVWDDIGNPEISLIKMDIEGHEYFALKGMERILTKNKALTVFVEIRSSFLEAAGSSRDDIFEYMAKCGYSPYDFDANKKKFILNNNPRDGEIIIFSKIHLDMKSI